MKQENPNCRLIVVGPGVRLRNKYEKRIDRKGLKDVVFSGYAAYSELPRYYKTADIACFPATGWESFGIVLLEAMAVGKPVIASAINGYTSVLTNGVEGLTFPPKNIEKQWKPTDLVIQNGGVLEKIPSKGFLFLYSNPITS